MATAGEQFSIRINLQWRISSHRPRVQPARPTSRARRSRRCRFGRPHPASNDRDDDHLRAGHRIGSSRDLGRIGIRPALVPTPRGPRRADERTDEVAELGLTELERRHLLVEAQTPREIAAVGLTVEGVDHAGVAFDVLAAPRKVLVQ